LRVRAPHPGPGLRASALAHTRALLYHSEEATKDAVLTWLRDWSG